MVSSDIQVGSGEGWHAAAGEPGKAFSQQVWLGPAARSAGRAQLPDS
jgi:hypothetical protein